MESASLGFKWLVAALLLFGLLYPSAMKMATRENFTGVSVLDPNLRKTGADLYLSNPSLFCSLQQTFDATLTDHKNLLLYRSCIGIKDPKRNFKATMSSYINSLDYLVSKQHVRTNNFEHVTNRVREVIESVRLSNGTSHKIKGPVYVLMFQAPYYRDLRTGTPAAHSVIHVQPFNIKEYGYSSSIILRDIVENEPLGSMSPPEGVSHVFYIMFPMYDPANKLKVMTGDAGQASVNRCVDYWLNQSTADNMCRMKCINNDGYTCGCLNNKNEKPYKSVCLGPRDSKDLQKKEFVNYGAFYRVHEKHPVMLSMFDESAYVRDKCSAKV